MPILRTQQFVAHLHNLSMVLCGHRHTSLTNPEIVNNHHDVDLSYRCLNNEEIIRIVNILIKRKHYFQTTSKF